MVPTITPLPTIQPTASIPRPTPEPTATYAVHQDIESLVRKVLGLKLNTFDFEQYTEYRGNPFPDGRVGYLLDLSVTFPADRSREEMLLIAYRLMSELHYNFSESLMFASVIVRSYPDEIACAFGFGVGYLSTTQHLPRSQPSNLDAWFGALSQSDYFGDLPGQTDALIAYGIDPRNIPSCVLTQWKENDFFD
jgi:hypothetical protein